MITTSEEQEWLLWPSTLKIPNILMKYYIYIRIASESLQTLDASKQCQFQLKNFILPWVLHLTGNTCFFCSSNVDLCNKDRNKPLPVMTIKIKNNVLLAAENHKDEWGEEVFGRFTECNDLAGCRGSCVWLSIHGKV